MWTRAEATPLLREVRAARLPDHPAILRLLDGGSKNTLTHMALTRADGTGRRFYSMSSQIDAERRDYYDRLEARQRDTVDVTDWLGWFLGCLDRALAGAEDLLGTVLFKAKLWDVVNRQPVHDRQRKVLNRLLDGFEGYLTTSKYAKLAKCSADTALRDIRELVDRGIIKQNPGGGRSTSYRLATAEELPA